MSLSLGAALLAGCGAPPELRDRPGTPTPPGPPTGTTPGTGPPIGPITQPTATAGFSEEIAVDCDGEPGGDQVLDLLRAEEVLASGTPATVADGPVCSGEWQLTVVTVPDRDPLQVMTRGEGTLELVTAGTDVCTVEVRVQAPPGIRRAAGCVS